MNQEEVGNEANGLVPPAKPNEPLAHQRENYDEANRLDLPDKPNESLVYQK